MRVYSSLHINPSSESTVSLGSRGRAVTDLQEALVNAGYNPNGVDGIFGQGTRNAVLAFQRAHGLTADGVVGPNTWRALAAAANAPAPAPSASGEPTLRDGSTGAAVVTLQKELAADGFSAGAADGVFGRNTLAAVEKFQRAQGLSVDGVVGQQTWAALAHPKSSSPAPAPAPSGSEPTVQAGSRGAAVSTMQSLLTHAGYSTHGVDGVFGQNTLAALLSFQHAHGLTADGVCGPKTWAALESAHAAPPPAPAPSSGSHPTLRQGSSGGAVTQLQQLLNKYGFHCSVDGQFGPNTASEVMAYQYSRGLSSDGIVGPQTWAALLNGAPEVHSPTASSANLGRAVSIATEAVQMEQSSRCYDYTQAYGARTNEGLGPTTRQGNGRITFDCSGFVGAVYRAAGLPSPYTVGYTGTSYDVAGCANMEQVSESQAVPGDVVVFPDHIALYIGNGECISMGQEGDPKVVSVAAEAAYDNRGIDGFYHPRTA